MKYILPFFYTHKFNRTGIESWAYIFEYYVTLFIFTFLASYQSVDLLLIGLTLTAYMLIYEIGYMENNVYAIEKEKSPTLRHSDEEADFVRENFYKISLVRYLLAGALVGVMALWFHVLFFIVLLILTRTVFYLYNMQFRTGLVHRLLFMTLRYLRYFSPVWFLGVPAAVFAAIVAFVNLINNFAWYDRWGVHLPRFFGTKLFDALMYGGVGFSLLHHDLVMAMVLLYMAGIKLVLFAMVLLQKRFAADG